MQASKLLPVLRRDLQLTEAAPGFDGSPQWTLADPISGRYFKLTQQALRLLRHWSKRDPGAVLTAANNEPGLKLAEKDVEQLLDFLRLHDLISAADPEQRGSYAQKAKARHIVWWKSLLHQYLFFRIPLWRPEAFLNRFYPLLARHGAWLFKLLLPLVLLLGIFLVSRDWATYRHSFPHLFSMSGMAAFGVALVFAKFCHEMGHALLAKHAGCRVQSMGVAFIVLFPLFYTDVSDAWRLKSHRLRFIIGAGGILAELILACFALLAWSLLPEGPLKTAAFMLSSATWITTVVVNLNPLMRFDGYFLLSDLWRVDNLQERAYRLCRWRLREALFGYQQPPPERWSPAMQRKLLLWGYASWLWRFFLFLGIALVVYHFFIKVVGIVLMLIEISWFIALPMLREVKHWIAMRRASKPAALFRTTLFSAVILAVLFFPWKGSVSVPAVLEATRVTSLYAPVAAQIASVAVKDGQQVREGEVLMTLSSPDIDSRLGIERQQLDILQLELLRNRARQETASSSQVIEQQLAESLARYRGLQEQQARLTLRATQAGTVRDLASELHAGRWINPELVLARIVDTAELRARGYAEDSAVTRIESGMTGTFYADDPHQPARNVTLTHIAPTGSATLSLPSLASDKEGPIAVRRNKEGEAEPLKAQYAVDFAASTASGQPLPTQRQRGVVVLEGERESLLGGWLRHMAAVFIRESGF
ncbi:HlyD family efflux transporter periplasmic adaptor subunit [Pokkaliibacter sp. CJK22405]|uniref:HlyD family efflux transporter periplasmic adaptor subunit n=1 Tax=Pokkaliibacter sp. CJK22405 TaxID=3384615 RepID=UPI0039851541